MLSQRHRITRLKEPAVDHGRVGAVQVAHNIHDALHAVRGGVAHRDVAKSQQHDVSQPRPSRADRCHVVREKHLQIRRPVRAQCGVDRGQHLGLVLDGRPVTAAKVWRDAHELSMESRARRMESQGGARRRANSRANQHGTSYLCPSAINAESTGRRYVRQPRPDQRRRKRM